MSGYGDAGNSFQFEQRHDFEHDTELHHLASFIVLYWQLGQHVTDAISHVGLDALNTNHALVTTLHLRQHGTARPGQLQVLLGMTSGGVSRMLHRLTNDGFVRRTAKRSGDDGRVAPVELTPAGRRACRSLDLALANAREDCRPLAKEALMHLDAVRAAHGEGPQPDPGEVLTCLGVTAQAIDRAVSAAVQHESMRDFYNVVLLCHAELNGGARPVSLMELLRLSSGGITKLVDRAENAGLVERALGTIHSDRRGVVVEATRKGRSELRRALLGLKPHLPELWRPMHWIAEGEPA